MSTPEPMKPEITPQAPKGRGRKRLYAIVTVLVVVIAAVAVFVILYLGPGSIIVTSSNGQYIEAASQASFSATVSPPPLVSSTGIAWNFGDGATSSSTATSVGHTYANPGNFLVQATASLSNGRKADNSMGLFPIRVGPPSSTTPPLGTTSSFGVIAINSTLSSSGAPTIAVGDHIALVGAVAQPPTFAWAHQVSANTWTNYTWQVTLLTFVYGDGSSAATNASRVADPTTNALTADPFHVTHTFSTGGIYTVTLNVTTGNFSATQVNGAPATPAWTATGQTLTTTFGLTVAVGGYRILTYSGAIVNPGIITNMEAVTGGYTTLDPALDYESTGFEIIDNVYETLIEYNGTSTSSFVPVVADQVPTVANGMVSPDFMNYSFHIRQGMKFSNGDPITPWDVKYSITRTMLMNSGSPFPPGWIISQFLVPGTFIAGNNASTTFSIVDGAVSVNNATQTVTFHLVSPAPPLLFYQVMADTLGGSIMDHLWLESGGPKLTWTGAGFLAYEAYSFIQNYVPAWRNGAVGSGPFMIDYVANPNAVVMVPNPNFLVLPGVPAPTVKKVVLQYVADASTRELSLQSGQADIAGIPSDHFDVAKYLQGQGLIQVQFNPTLNEFWWNFNLEIYQSAVGSNANPYGNQVPKDFFVDINMRKAFAYAFDYNQYLNQIVGNQKFNATFGIPYNGIIPKGMVGYQDLTALNIFDMTKAQQAFNQTQWFKDGHSGFTLAINVESADTVNRAAAAAWAQNIAKLAPGITILIKPISFAEMIADSVPHVNPMGIYFLGWLADYPFPTDYTLPMELPADSPVASSTPNGGTYPNANGWNIQYLAADKNGTNQVNDSRKIRNLILDSISAPNATNVNAVVSDSDQAQTLAANLWMTVPAFQQFTFFSFRTWISGMPNELNPTLGGADLLYNVITKPSTLTTSSVGASSGFAIDPVALALTAPLATIGLAGLAERRRP